MKSTFEGWFVTTGHTTAHAWREGAASPFCTTSNWKLHRDQNVSDREDWPHCKKCNQRLALWLRMEAAIEPLTFSTPLVDALKQVFYEIAAWGNHEGKNLTQQEIEHIAASIIYNGLGDTNAWRLENMLADARREINDDNVPES